MALPSAVFPGAIVGVPGEINTSKDNGKTYSNITPADLTIPGSYLNQLAVEIRAMQGVSATDKVLGRSSAGAGVIQEIACTAAGRALIDDADAAALCVEAARVACGLHPGEVARAPAGGHQGYYPGTPRFVIQQTLKSNNCVDL